MKYPEDYTNDIKGEINRNVCNNCERIKEDIYGFAYCCLCHNETNSHKKQIFSTKPDKLLDCDAKSI